MALTDSDIAQISKAVATKGDIASSNTRIEGLDAKVATMNERASALDDRMSAFEIRLEDLNTRIGGIELGIIDVQRKVAETNERMSVFEAKLDQHLVLLDKLIGAACASNTPPFRRSSRGTTPGSSGLRRKSASSLMPDRDEP